MCSLTFSWAFRRKLSSSMLFAERKESDFILTRLEDRQLDEPALSSECVNSYEMKQGHWSWTQKMTTLQLRAFLHNFNFIYPAAAVESSFVFLLIIWKSSSNRMTSGVIFTLIFFLFYNDLLYLNISETFSLIFWYLNRKSTLTTPVRGCFCTQPSGVFGSFTGNSFSRDFRPFLSESFSSRLTLSPTTELTPFWIRFSPYFRSLHR